MQALNKVGFAIVVVAALVATFASSLAADKQREHDDLVKKDLFAVITLQGHDCGKVVTFERRKQHDYLATCKNGQTFRIYVVPEGRVAVEGR